VIDKARFKLENTEERIAKIKKNVRGLFDIIDKKPFFRKLETFLDTVLETTISSNKTNRKDVEQNLYYKTDIILPEFVSPIFIVSNSPDNFNYPAFYESFSNPKNQKVELRIVNKEAIQRARDKKMKEKERAVKIEAWLNEILEKLKSQPEIDFSQLYFDVLNKEQDIETVVKGTEYILKKLRKKKFKIELSNEFIINENNANNSIWNIRIKNTTSN
jgi:predicted RNA-binding protein Jag